MKLRYKKSNIRNRRSAAPDLARHARKCAICHHPERDAIELDFVRWRHPGNIVDDDELPSRSALYRHAEAARLYRRRQHNLRAALEHIIQEAEGIVVTADTITRAVRVYARLSNDGRWVDPPRHIIVTHRSEAEPSRANLMLGVSTRDSAGNNEPVEPLLPGATSRRAPVLIGTPERLEIDATPTKQTDQTLSNRDTHADLSQTLLTYK